jgi:uncharacterized coiled-coil protein SlyX
MLSGKSLRFAMPLIVACSLLPRAATALSQDSQTQQTQSVADAARRARQDKKNAAAKSSKVITDDDLDKTPKPGAEGLNVGAPPKSDSQPPSPAAVAAAEAADQPATSTTKDSSKKAGPDPEITKLKGQIAQAKKELDLLQRELALDQDTFYSKMDYAHDTAGKAKLASEQQQIDDKQQQLEGLKTRLAALQELQERDKNAAAGDAAPPAPTPPQP